MNINEYMNELVKWDNWYSNRKAAAPQPDKEGES